MNIKIINSIDDLNEYKLVWSDILKKSNNNNPFLEIDWIINWWKYFGQDKEMFVAVIFKNKNVIGFSPFMIVKKGFNKEMNFIGYPISSYNDIITIKENKKYVISQTMQYIFKKKYLLNLSGLENNDTFEIITKYLNDNKKKYTIIKNVSYFIEIKENFKDYYNEIRNGQIKNIDKREKRLKKLGKVEYKMIDDEDIEQIFRLHDKRWMKKNDTSNFSSGNTKAFFKELALNNDYSFKTKVYGIYLNNKIIAYKYGLFVNDRYLYYRICHDDDYSIYSPGKIITKYIIKDSFDNKIKYFDFGIGYEPYKTHWTNTYSNVYKIIFSTKKISLSYTIYKLKEQIIQILKRNYKIVNLKRNTLGKIKYYISHKNIDISEIFKKIININSYKIIEMNLNDFSTKNNIKKGNINDLEIISKITNKKNDEIINLFYYGYKLFKRYDNKELKYAFWIKDDIKLIDINYNEDLDNESIFIYDIWINKKYSNISILNEISSFLKYKGLKKYYLKVSKINYKYFKETLDSNSKYKLKIFYVKIFNKYLKGL